MPDNLMKGTQRWVPVLLGVLLLVVLTVNLDSTPPIWWDEGWTLSVARNWVETGHYGHLLEGKPSTDSMAAGFPVVAPVALSFKLLGVGIWQGRLPEVLFTMGSLLLVFYLAKNFYRPAIAWGTLGVLLLMIPGGYLNPLLVGRQVLGEMPMVLYLLVGYAGLHLSLRRSAWFLLPAVVFWGMALMAKAQTLPFWVVSLAIPLGVTLFKRWWRASLLLALGLAGGWEASHLFLQLQGMVLAGQILPRQPLVGLYQVTAMVPDWGVRFMALRGALIAGLPTFIGLVYGGRVLFKQLNQNTLDRNNAVMRIVFLALAGSWFLWYLILAMSWIRYLFPAIFFGSLFTAAMLYDLTGKFDLRATIRRASGLFLKRNRNRLSLGAVLAVVLVTITLPFNTIVFVVIARDMGNSSAMEVTQYLDETVPADAIIETYDSEILFLSHLKIHYPPDQVSVELMHRAELDPAAPVDYNPLSADPDYLVVGPMSRNWHLYDQVLESGQFRQIRDGTEYQVYQRVRP